MDKKAIFRAGIIGAGKIGSLWDEEGGAAQSPKTHALGFVQNPQTKLVAICDQNGDRARTAAQTWQAALATDNLDEFLAQELDIISVCLHLRDRDDVLRQIVKKQPQAVLFLEKPLAETFAEGQQTAQVLAGLQYPVTINYTRRFATGIRQLKQMIAENKLGVLQKGTATYGNGLVNNGTHMLDLLQFLVGTPLRVQATGKTPDDRIGADESIDALLFYQNSTVLLQTIDQRQFTMFELDLLFTKGRVRLFDRGFRATIQSVAVDQQFAGHRVLTSPEAFDTKMETAFIQSIQDLVRLKSGEMKQPACTVDDALKTLRLADCIKDSISAGKVVEIKFD